MNLIMTVVNSISQSVHTLASLITKVDFTAVLFVLFLAILLIGIVNLVLSRQKLKSEKQILSSEIFDKNSRIKDLQLEVSLLMQSQKDDKALLQQFM